MPKECWELQATINPDRGTMTLPEICQELHEMTTGSMDCDPKIRDKYIQILALAKVFWVPEPDFTKHYDDAVLNLIEVTLDEAIKRNS
jgi:hypothetical protein